MYLPQDFFVLQKYARAFFGDKKTIEDLCRMMIMDDVKHLYQCLGEFAYGGSVTHIEEGSWFDKWPNIFIAIGPPKEEEADEP